MSITWGDLAKSQIDDEKIEEAIERIVAEHNDDPEAHVKEGQALQSHKAAEVIDHLAKSIVRDKLADRSVEPSAFIKNKVVFQPYLIDDNSWHRVTDGNNYHLNFRKTFVEIRPGNSLNDVCSIGLLQGPFQEVEPILLPMYEFKMKTMMGAISLMRSSNVDRDPFETTKDKFGFEYQYSDNYVSAYYMKNGTVTKQVLNGYTPFSAAYYRAELLEGSVSGKYDIMYYINGEFVHKFEDIELSFYGDRGPSFGCKNISGEQEYENLLIGDIYYYHNLPS